MPQDGQSTAIRTLHAQETGLDALLDALDRAQRAYRGLDRRAGARKIYRRRLQLRLAPTAGAPPRSFEVITRNLSTAGIGFIHGGYIHTGTPCELDLLTLDNAWQTVTGIVAHCRLLRGRIHYVGVRFDDPVHMDRFIPGRLSGKILLADDSPDFCALAEHHLTKDGLSVTTVSGGREALELLLTQEGEFDLILLDVQMPELSGLEVIRQLRERGVDTPIIAISADDSPDSRARCDEAGADDFLPKPMDRQQLADVMRYYVGDGRPQISSFAHDPELRNAIVRFVDGLPERLRQMRQAMLQHDAALLTHQARELKTVASGKTGYGFEEVSEAARELEAALTRSVDWSIVAQRMMKLAGLARRASGDA